MPGHTEFGIGSSLCCVNCFLQSIKEKRCLTVAHRGAAPGAGGAAFCFSTWHTAQQSSPSLDAAASAQGGCRAGGNPRPAKKDVGCCPQPRGKGSLMRPCPAPPQALAPLDVALLGTGPCPSVPPPSPSWARDLHTRQHTVIPVSLRGSKRDSSHVSWGTQRCTANVAKLRLPQAQFGQQAW